MRVTRRARAHHVPERATTPIPSATRSRRRPTATTGGRRHGDRVADAAGRRRARIASARPRPSGDRRESSRTSVAVGRRAAGERRRREGDRYLELIADKRTYAPGDTARLIVRGETDLGADARHQGRPARRPGIAVLRPGAGDAIEVPIEAGDVGDIYVNIAFMREGRLYRAERRLSVPASEQTLQITLTRRSARGQAAGARRLLGARHRRRRRAGQRAGQPRRDRRSGLRDPARTTRRIPCASSIAASTAASARRSRATTTSPASRASERLQLARRRRRPFTLADFKGDKQVQPQVRKDFPDAIYWIGDLVTDADGPGEGLASSIPTR